MTEVPKITAGEAAVLRTRLYHPSLLARAHARIALHGWDDENAAVGEAALARYEAEREREIRKPLEDLIRKLQDRCGSVSCAGCEGMWQEPHGPYQHKPGCPIDAICRSEVHP